MSAASASVAKDDAIAEPQTDAIVLRAVQFLQHEKVRDAPTDAKRRFLEGKSLTPDQVAEALRLAGVTEPSAKPASSQPVTAAAPSPGSSESSISKSKFLMLGGVVGSIIGGALTFAALRWSADASGRSDPSTDGTVGAATSSAGASTPGDAQTPLTLKLKTSTLVDAAAQDPISVTPRATAATASAAAQSPRTDESLAALRSLRDTRTPKATAATALQPEQALAAVGAAVDELVAASGALVDGEGSRTSGAAEVAHALQTLVVLLSTQLRHHTEARYQRLNPQNANLQRMLALPSSRGVLHALGFAEQLPAAPSAPGGEASGVAAGSAGAFWLWRDGKLPDAADLEAIAAQRDLLARRAASLVPS